jgi:hypothetical protein
MAGGREPGKAKAKDETKRTHLEYGEEGKESRKGRIKWMESGKRRGEWKVEVEGGERRRGKGGREGGVVGIYGADGQLTNWQLGGR